MYVDFSEHWWYLVVGLIVIIVGGTLAIAIFSCIILTIGIIFY